MIGNTGLPISTAPSSGANIGITATGTPYTLAGTASQTYTLPSTTATLARTDAGQTFTGLQTLAGGGSSAGLVLGATAQGKVYVSSDVSGANVVIKPSGVGGFVVSTSNGAGDFTVCDKDGNGVFNNLRVGSDKYFGITSRALILAPSDGVVTLYNYAQSDFSRLQLGGTTSSFPALGRSTTFITAGLADGSAGGGILFTGTGVAKFGATASATIGVSADTTAGNLVFTPSSTGGFLFGNTTAVATATPLKLSLGGTYGNNTAGATGNLKLFAYESGGDSAGFGISLAKLEYQANGALTDHVFYVGGTAVLDISSSSALITGTKTLKFGATASATIGVSADTTAGRLDIKPPSSGSLALGNQSALATNATDGFVYIRGGAGTPTGAPTAVTGLVPLYVDTTNNKLYFYTNSAWRDAGP